MFTKIVRSATHTITSNIQNAASTRASSRTRLPAALLACAALTMGPANLTTAAVVSGGSEAYNLLINVTSTVSGSASTELNYIAGGTPDGNGDPDTWSDSNGVAADIPTVIDTTASINAFSNDIAGDISPAAPPAFAFADSQTTRVTANAAPQAVTTVEARDVNSNVNIEGDFNNLSFTADAQLDFLTLNLLGNPFLFDFSVFSIANPGFDGFAPNTDLIAFMTDQAQSDLLRTIGVTVIANEQFLRADGTDYCGTTIPNGAYTAGSYTAPTIGCDPGALLGGSAVQSLYAEANSLHIYFEDVPFGAGIINGDIILGHTRAYMTAQVPEINGSQLGIALSLLLSLILLYRERDGGFVA